MLIGQVGENREINAVFSKTIRVLGSILQSRWCLAWRIRALCQYQSQFRGTPFFSQCADRAAESGSLVQLGQWSAFLSKL
jgi:hypothetical protein